MSTILAVVALAAVVLLGWAVAEWKGKHVGYTVSEEEKEAAIHEAAHRPADGREMNIQDVKKVISTKGFKAI